MQTTKKISVGLLAILSLMFSCKEDVIEITGNDEVSIENDATTDSYFEEVDDISNLALVSDDATNTGGKSGESGRKININDNRFECASVEITVADDNTFVRPKGTITIDFGTGCVDNRGNVRKGKIIVTYDGRRFLPGSKAVTTFDGYSINDVLIEGVRTLTNASESLEDRPKFNISVENGKATWPDGTFATRDANHTREWFRGANPINDEWKLTGSAVGKNRSGSEYTMEIIEPLLYKRSCAVLNKIFLAVEGEKIITTDLKVFNINYGDGECDRLVTVTVNGESKEVEVEGKD